MFEIKTFIRVVGLTYDTRRQLRLLAAELSVKPHEQQLFT